VESDCVDAAGAASRCAPSFAAAKADKRGPVRRAAVVLGGRLRASAAVVAAMKTAVLILPMALAPGAAQAWGAAGHRIVAGVAQERMTPAARQELAQLLSLEPGGTLEGLATWADEVKSPSTARWHFVNLPRDSDCVYAADRDCPDGKCVVGAIHRQSAILASKAPAAKRLAALKFVVHLVADVHQPLHAGYADDKGGNLYQVHAFGHGNNLHVLWDSGLIEAWPSGVGALRSSALKSSTTISLITEPERWAEESCRVVAAEGFYPSTHNIDAAYSERAWRVVHERLVVAGWRLATLLNQARYRRRDQIAQALSPA